ncbi:MAG: cell division protein ZapA [Clostridia bacterium]|nr:cell division protein ZapA [Clostridia bacterium]
MKEKIYVEIAGVKLGIVTEDGAEYVNQIASRVNDDIKSLMKAQRSCSLIEAALFCAMNYCSQGGEDSMKVKNLETQVALYQANLNRTRKEIEELRAKLNNEEQ